MDDNYDPIKTVTLGYFGTVMLVENKRAHRKESHKIFNNTKATTEIKAKTGRCHPFLLEWFDSFEMDGNKFVFVMSYVEGDQLSRYLWRDKVFSEERSRFYAAEIIAALEHLHQQGLVHKDLTLDNVFVEDDGHIKLTDFGFIEQEISRVKRGELSTPHYLAPEVLESKSFEVASDWWAFGVVLCTMLCGQMPFCSDSYEGLLEVILKGEPNLPSSLSEPSKDILVKLLEKTPAKRLSDDGDFKVTHHKFFESINWRDVYCRRMVPSFVPRLSRYPYQ